MNAINAADLMRRDSHEAAEEEFVASLATESRHYLNAIIAKDLARRDSHGAAGDFYLDWWVARKQFVDRCTELADAVKASRGLLPTLFKRAAKSSLSGHCLSACIEQVLRAVESINARVVRISDGSGAGARIGFRYASEADEIALVKDLEPLSNSVLELTKWVTTFRMRDQERKLIAEACAALHQVAPYVCSTPDTVTASFIAGQPVMVAGDSGRWLLDPLQKELTALPALMGTKQ